MFTGIITDLGVVKAVEAPDSATADARFVFQTAYDTAAIPDGASIACSGVCLTVVERGEGWFAADVSGETLARSTLGDCRARPEERRGGKEGVSTGKTRGAPEHKKK